MAESAAAPPIADLDGVILCGGLGTRLRSAVPDRPKVLAEVGGRPFLEILLAELSRRGVRRFVLCAGFRSEALVAAAGALERFGEIALSVEPMPLGTGGALRHALPQLRSDPFFALNGDSICPVALGEMLELHRRRAAEATLAVVPAAEGEGFGSVRLDAGGALASFDEKAPTPRGGYHNAGVYLLSRALIEALPDAPLSLERDVFPTWVGRRAYGYVHRGAFLDIGTPERFRAASALLAELGLGVVERGPAVARG